MSNETDENADLLADASVCSTAAIPYEVHQQQMGKVLYEVEAILDHCRDQEGWRFRSIREAAERIESVFVLPMEPPHDAD